MERLAFHAHRASFRLKESSFDLEKRIV